MPCPINTTVYSASAWDQVGPAWAELARASPYSSFFLSESWTGAWLEVFGATLDARILVFEAGQQVIGACLLVARIERRGPIRIKRVYLNTAGEDEVDSACIEFNNLLCRAGCEEAVAQALEKYLRSQTWDELVADGFADGVPLKALYKAFAGCRPVVTPHSSYYVDLARLRQQGVSYESALGSKTRKHLRQSMRAYGDLRLEAAEETGTALQMIEELAGLHQQSWVARGRKGSFASPLFFAFHQSLIRRALPQGAIQLLRVSAPGQTVGLLYSFVRGGKVYFYQSGLRYSEDGRHRPGVVTVACAIRYSLEKGLDDFDFLAGDAQYKQALSTDCRPLIWAVFQRPSFKMRLIGFLRQLKRGVKKGRFASQ